MVFLPHGIPRAFRTFFYFGINFSLILEASGVAKGAQVGSQNEVQTCLDGVLGQPERAPKNDLELTQLQTRIFERLGVDLARFWGGFQRVLRSILR